jgi:hypothetical protein
MHELELCKGHSFLDAGRDCGEAALTDRVAAQVEEGERHATREQLADGEGASLTKLAITQRQAGERARRQQRGESDRLGRVRESHEGRQVGSNESWTIPRAQRRRERAHICRFASRRAPDPASH